MGFGKYLISDFKGLSGKMKDLNITSIAGQFKTVFNGKKGTFIMIAKKNTDYTGYVTIYNGKKVIGGNDHMYANDVEAVYLYVADKNKTK